MFGAHRRRCTEWQDCGTRNRYARGSYRVFQERHRASVHRTKSSLGNTRPIAIFRQQQEGALSAHHHREQQGVIKGQDGADGPDFNMLFFADAIVPFGGFCNPLNIHGEDITGIGEVEGGHGGDGGDISIIVNGGRKTTLTIQGPFCNQPGGKGGAARAKGEAAKPCEDGNPATAWGGTGGDSGYVSIVAPRIDFGKNPMAHFNLGGSGGLAFVEASDAVFCPTGCEEGGWGRTAIATGGDSGYSGNIDIVTGRVQGGLNRLLAGLTTNRPEGGSATALGGTGAIGGSQCVCGQPGGNGGWGGEAFAYGGDGQYSAVLYTRMNNNKGTEDGFNGPIGGFASAVSGAAGAGSPGGDCPCEEEVVAGKGGDGGEGRIAQADAGVGGDAYYPPATAGPGGSASATCGNGGDGGKGGSCFNNIAFPHPPKCKPGSGGSGGGKGGSRATGGDGGQGKRGAMHGSRGFGSTQDCKDGRLGPSGDWKCLD